MNKERADQIKKALEQASFETSEFIVKLDENQLLNKAFSQFQISEDDQPTFISEITNMALGITEPKDLIDNILVETTTEEENVLKAISAIAPLLDSIPSHPQHIASSSEILQHSILTEDAVPQHENLTPSDILSEIENPTPTTTKPDMVLPTSKPNTSDILKKLSTPATEPSTPTISAMPASNPMPPELPGALPTDLDLSVNTDGIIDPFKPRPAATGPTPISAQMETKMSSMTGADAKESFKILPLSETMKNLTANQATGVKPHDPYREPIE